MENLFFWLLILLNDSILKTLSEQNWRPALSRQEFLPASSSATVAHRLRGLLHCVFRCTTCPWLWPQFVEFLLSWTCLVVLIPWRSGVVLALSPTARKLYQSVCSHCSWELPPQSPADGWQCINFHWLGTTLHLAVKFCSTIKLTVTNKVFYSILWPLKQLHVINDTPISPGSGPGVAVVSNSMKTLFMLMAEG